MEVLTRIPGRPLRNAKICTSCLQRLQQHQTPRPSIPPRTLQRTYTTTPTFQKPSNQNQTNQAHPLGDFYADLLSTPLSSLPKASTTLPTFVSTGGDTTKEERAAKLFGSIKGSGYERRSPTISDSTWQTINGVAIPPRPAEPENCCMSGCVHCVWDDYRDDIEEWAGRLKTAQAKAGGISAVKTPKVDMHRPEVVVAAGSMDDDGGGSEGLWEEGSGADAEELFKGIPVGIREFMNVEKKIRERKRERSGKGS